MNQLSVAFLAGIIGLVFGFTGCASPSEEKTETPLAFEFDRALGECTRAIDFITLSNQRTDEAEKRRCCLAALEVPLDASPPGVRAESLTSRGRAKAALDDMDGAEADYRAALAIVPEQPEANFRLALLLDASRDKPEEALPLYLNALLNGVDPTYVPGLHYYVGVIHLRSGRYEEAIESLSESLRMSEGARPSDLALARACRAAAYERIDQHARALADIQAASVAMPEDELIRKGLAGYAYSAGDASELERGVKLFEGSPADLKIIEADLERRGKARLVPRLRHAALVCGRPGKPHSLHVGFSGGTGVTITSDQEDGRTSFKVVGQRLGAEGLSSLKGYMGLTGDGTRNGVSTRIELWGTVDHETGKFTGACRFTSYTGTGATAGEPFKVVGEIQAQ